jgi:hypothetical protein
MIEIYRLRMNAELKPKTSVPLKGFLKAFDAVPDANQELTFKVYPGRKPQVVMATVINPLTGRSWQNVEEEIDSEALQQQWRDKEYFEQLWLTALAKIEEANQSVPVPAVPQPAVKPTPRSVPKPAAKPLPQTITQKETVTQRSLGLEGTSANFIGKLVKKGALTPTPDQHSYLTFALQTDSEQHPCVAWDALAIKLDGLYRNGNLVHVEGIWQTKKSDLSLYLRAEVVEAALSDDLPASVGDALIEITVHLDRIGWTKRIGSKHLQETYGKNTRAELDDDQVFDFLTYLKAQPTPANAR